MPKTKNTDLNRLRLELQNFYFMNFYDLFMNEWKFEGVTYQQNRFILNQFWNTGEIACFKEKTTGMPIFTPFSAGAWNLYNYPAWVTLVENHPSNEPMNPNPLIPKTPMIVNQDVVICYANASRRPIKLLALSIIKRIVELEMLIRSNINSMKMPYVITCSPEDKARLQDLVDKLMNDEEVIYLNAEDVQNIKALITSTPYLLDKLMQQKKERENELLTLLGINNIDIEKKEHLIVDEANANNQLINAHANVYQNEFENFCEDIQSVLGLEISVKCNCVDTDILMNDNEGNQDEGGNDNA